VKIICPEIATYINNCYNSPARLVITGGKEISSQEGTTQGDPIAMEMYAIGLMPLLSTISAKSENLSQVAFADNLTGIIIIIIMKNLYTGYYISMLHTLLLTCVLLENNK
jgi:hypothetical protein